MYYCVWETNEAHQQKVKQSSNRCFVPVIKCTIQNYNKLSSDIFW